MTQTPNKGPKPISPRQLMNELNLKIYAGVLAGLMVLFIIVHWVRYLSNKYHSSPTWRRFPGARLCKTLSRKLDGYAARPVPGFPSLGHAILILVYFGLNVLFCFIHVDSGKASNFAARFGWMTTANMVLAVFFGLKNTPIAILSHHSYDRLNFLHQVVGYTAVAQMVAHAVGYLVWDGSRGKWATLIEPDNWKGIAAGVSMLILGLGALRHVGYELFYLSHIAGFILAAVFTALHRPNWVDKIPIAILVAVGIWALDRTIRASRLLYNLPGNKASLYPLPNGGVRVVFKRKLAWALPGSHCFVWIPGVRPFETHPFTIVANSDSGLELVLKSYSGFTKSVHDYAAASPGIAVLASFDGPYGSFPDPSHYDKIVLIAGGSGATFTFGLVATLLDRLGPDSKQQIEFIWAIKSRENLAWFTEHLEKLKQHQSYVSLTVHVTDQMPDTSSDENLVSNVILNDSSTEEGQMEQAGLDRLQRTLDEKADDAETISSLPDLKYEKLRVERVISESIETVGKDGRVLVAVCGPLALSNVVTTEAAKHIKVDGPSIEIHRESFGW